MSEPVVEATAVQSLWWHLHRSAVAFNVAVYSGLGVWTVWRHWIAGGRLPLWVPVVMVAALIPGWTAATWRGEGLDTGGSASSEKGGL